MIILKLCNLTCHFDFHTSATFTLHTSIFLHKMATLLRWCQTTFYSQIPLILRLLFQALLQYSQALFHKFRSSFTILSGFIPYIQTIILNTFEFDFFFIILILLWNKGKIKQDNPLIISQWRS